MRQAVKRRKKFQSRISLTIDPGKKIPRKIGKKIKKPLSGIIFSQNGLRQAEKERKKNLVANSVHSQPGQEYSVKSSKKNQKIKIPRSSIIFSQNGMRQPGKERKKIQSRIPFILDQGKNIPKKIAKKIKKLKNLGPALFLSKKG